MANQKQVHGEQGNPGLLGNEKKLKEILGSPEVRQLADLLNQKSGGGLKSAAQDATDGNTAQLEQMIRSLSATPDGAKLIGRIQDKLEQ